MLAVTMASGCGSKPDQPVATDEIMELHARAGSQALVAERPEQAMHQFEQGLTRARARDDPGAIADLGFDLGVAQLRAGNAAAALTTAREVNAEMARRGTGSVMSLRLVEAIALYRSGNAAAADAAAAEVEAGQDPEAAAQAAFLRGLIADDAGDAAGLRAALGRVGAANEAEDRANAAELSARLALRTGDPSLAQAEAIRATELHRTLMDYRAVARCLALAARASEQAGNLSSAADLYLRAGRSAVGQGDRKSAREWLNRAIALSRDAALSQAARTALKETEKTP